MKGHLPILGTGRVMFHFEFLLFENTVPFNNIIIKLKQNYGIFFAKSFLNRSNMVIHVRLY